MLVKHAFMQAGRSSGPFPTPVPVSDMRGPFEIVNSLGLSPITGIVQVGASTGQEVPYFVANGVRRATLIEPLDGPFEVLKAQCRHLDEYVLVQALCGSRDGETVDFHVASNNGESSSMLKPANHLADYPWVSFPQVVPLKTVTLDSIFAMVRARRPEIAAAANLLYMDVQGAELRVLAGATTVLNSVSYIYTETGVGGGYEGDVELIDLINFLRPHNFKVYELESNTAGWGNAMLIRRADR